jgi:hypothetical protein
MDEIEHDLAELLRECNGPDQFFERVVANDKWDVRRKVILAFFAGAVKTEGASKLAGILASYGAFEQRGGGACSPEGEPVYNGAKIPTQKHDPGYG